MLCAVNDPGIDVLNAYTEVSIPWSLIFSLQSLDWEQVDWEWWNDELR